MTRIEFDQMVENLERVFRGRGAALTRSALAWAVLGYLALTTALAASLGIVAACVAMVVAAPGAVTIKLGFLFGIGAAVVAWSILRGAWIRFSPPVGEEIREADAPGLFRLIGDTSALAGGVPLAKVLVTPDLNACVVQTPRLGIFGWHRNYLCLGMPLMDSLAPDEFHAVLAHEFAHLSKSHGRTGNWIYRIRRSWENVAESLAGQGGLLVRPLAAFFGWFWPRFNARAFVLSRANEYEADAFSARAASPAAAASALTRIAIQGRRLTEDFWAGMERRVAVEPEPPRGVFDEIAALARTPVEPANGNRWLDQEYSSVTDTSDTHPGLRDRVAALGAGNPGVPPPIGESAADRFLGKATADGLRARFNQSWYDASHADWKSSAAESRANREKLDLMTGDGTAGADSWEALRLKCEVNGIHATAGELAAFVGMHPEHCFARYLLGRHLLSTDNPEGIRHLEHVAGTHPQHAIDCFSELASYHDRRGNAEAIRELKMRADQHEALLERAIIERNNPHAGDRFLAHGLAAAELEAVRRALASIPDINEAWLARRDTREMPEWKSYVLIVRFGFGAFRFVTQGRIQGLLQQADDSLELDGFLVVLHDKGNNKPVAKRIRAVDGTRVAGKDG